ncbi:irregular chiasm C-roughest protein-like isoform X2 [Daphnia pulicaria]|nr:irregular chiasm C-roughest protein-like isoform X2 [Daphnia pulicaria]
MSNRNIFEASSNYSAMHHNNKRFRQSSSPADNRRRDSHLFRWSLVVLAFVCSVGGSNGQANGQSLRQVQRFEREPEDQTAVVGETVVMACRVLNKGGVLQWTKDDFGLGSDRNLSGFERYSMIGTEDEGTFSLQIRPVTLEDDGRFQCQVSPGPEPASMAIRSRYATLAVTIPPEPPQIVQGSHLITTEDREVELECQSRSGKPAAEIIWLDGDGNLITNNVEVFKEVLADGKRTNVKSVLKLSPKMHYHNKNITCQAQNAAERSPRSVSLLMEVKYAPKVTVTVEQGRIAELESVRLSCHADANPPNVVYKWYINDEIAYGDYTTELTIASASRKLNGAIVKCEVTNAVGKGEDNQTLSVHYSPEIRSRPSNVEADIGSNVTLRCDVNGNPEPEISWTYEGSRRVLSTGPAYTFWMNHDMAGKYTCTARVPGFAEVSADAHVFLKGPPTVRSKRIQFGHEGDTVRIECVAFAVPRPSKITWTHRGYEIDAGDPYVTFDNDPLPDGVRSTLIIREANDKYFGSYNCSVANDYGMDAAEIILRKESGNLQLLFISAGVVGGIVVLIACVMIIVVCQRRSNKKVEEGDKGDRTSKQSDQTSNNDSDLKVDIRTASSLSNPPESEQWDDSSERITPRAVISNGDAMYRYAPGDYTDAQCFPPPKAEGHNNNGYVPYVDYGRDYNPAFAGVSNSQASLYATNPHTVIPMTGIDPRFSAAYGNPYLRSSTTSLPPPHLNGGLATYGSVRSGPAPQVAPARTPPPSAVSPHSQYIVSNKAQLKPGTLATHV